MVARRQRVINSEPTIRIVCTDVLDGLRGLADESVHCVVTSPPYWGLRDYGTAVWEGGELDCDHVDPDRSLHSTYKEPGDVEREKARATQLVGAQYRGNCRKCGAKRVDSQIGLEASPQAYVDRIVEVFREVRRVLREDGICYLNLGDSYNGGGRESHGSRIGYKQGTNRASAAGVDSPRPNAADLKSKDLVGIPWRVAFALQADGWYLRQDIIWSKPNPMPESVTDRCTKAHEYIFLLTKSDRYFYDAEAIAEKSLTFDGTDPVRNKRSVWTVTSQPYAKAHFATFPPALIEPCIKAGTSARGCCPDCGAPWQRIIERETSTPRQGVGYNKGAGRNDGDRPGGYLGGESRTVGWYPSCHCYGLPPLPDYPPEPDDDALAGVQRKSGFIRARVSIIRPALLASAEVLPVVPCTVLDPFGGAGTTGLVSSRLNRSSILLDLNPEYCAMAVKRIRNDAPFLANRVEYV